MRKRRLAVGKLIPGTKLRVLARAPSRGNQRVVVRCEAEVNGRVCGNEKVMRLNDITRKPYVDKNGKARLPHRSCGCQSRRAHREYWERRAKGIPLNVQRNIFLRHQSGVPFKYLAEERKLPLAVVTTIYRLEVSRQRAAALERAARIKRRRRGTADTAAERSVDEIFRESFAKRGIELPQSVPDPGPTVGDESFPSDEPWFDQAAADEAWVVQLAEERKRESVRKRGRGRC